MVITGFVVAAEIAADLGLTGQAFEVEAEEGERLYKAGTHVLFGTWRAFNDELCQQQRARLAEECT